MSTPTPPPVTLQGVLSHLIGLDGWLDAAASSRRAYTSEWIKNNVIPARVRRFERETQFRINQVQVVSSSRDDGAYSGANTPLDAFGNPLPVVPRDGTVYTQEDADEYFRLTLTERPLLQIQRIRMMLGNQTVFTIPVTWYSTNPQTDLFTIAPVSGTLLIQSVVSFAQIQIAFAGKGYLPNAIQIDYQAGLPANWQNFTTTPLGHEFADLARAVEEYCALGILEDIAHLADAGLLGVSVSSPGSSESRQYSRFKDRKEELAASFADFKETLTVQETPIMIGWV